MSYYIASCSCGNDSMAMVQELVFRRYPLDEIVFYSNGMDFQAIYRLWELVKQKYEPIGVKCQMLEPDYNFTDKMFNIEVKNRDGSGTHKGYSWCGGRCRWGTTDKMRILDTYCESKNAIVYVGIAADEQHRTPDKPYKVHPLKDWGMTQADCLKYNKEHGVEWLEDSVFIRSFSFDDKIDLYTILDRVSCWCCANKNQWELYNIWKYLPQYWEKLKELQKQTSRPFKSGKYGYTIFEIEERFRNGYVPKHRAKKM